MVAGEDRFAADDCLAVTELGATGLTFDFRAWVNVGLPLVSGAVAGFRHWSRRPALKAAFFSVLEKHITTSYG